jgi:hypothetical protein
VYEPRLLKPAKPAEVVPLKLPAVKVLPAGVFEAVVPPTVISSARARPTPKTKIATSINVENSSVRFKNGSY